MFDEKDIYGIAYRCPYLHRKDNCHLKEVDHLLFKEKVGWVQGLSVEKKEAILNRHKICSKNREHEEI